MGKIGSCDRKHIRASVARTQGSAPFELLHNVFSTGITYEAKEAQADLVVKGKLQTYFLIYIYKAIRNEEGEVFAIINTVSDVTELVNTRRQIAQTQDEFSFAVSAAGMGTWNFYPQTQHVTFDDQCRKLFGFPDDLEFNYENALSCIYPEDTPKVERAVQCIYRPAEKRAIRYSVPYHNQDTKEIRWLHCKGKAYFDSNNHVYRFSGIAQDITEEVKSRQSELQLLSLVSKNVDHMSVASMDGKVLYLNESARKMLGVGLEDDVAQFSAVDFYKPDELKRVQGHVLKEIHEKTGWQGILRLMNRSTKEEIPCYVNYILIKDPVTGEVIGRGATARDLRPEIKANAELQRLATIVDVSEDFCNYSDVEGNTLYMNEAGCKLIALEPGRLTSYRLFDYHSEQSNEMIRNEIIPQLYATGKWSGTLELVHQQTGELIPIHKQAFLIREQITGEAMAIAGIARDLRPENNARKAIADKNEELKKAITEMEFLANMVPCFVWTCLPNGKLDYVNKRWYDESDMKSDDIADFDWGEALHPDDIPSTHSAWAHSMSTGEPLETEFRYRMKDQNYRWFLVRAQPLHDSEGNIIKWYGTSIDVQVQKELERQKDNFLGIASHELKTPVTSLKAYAQVMEMMFTRANDSKNAGLVAKMDKQLNRLNSLIGDLLDVTKINTGKLQFSLSKFDFLEMVEEVIEDMQRTTARHFIRKQLHFTGTLLGDRDRISQVVVNLLSNAIKYSPEANEIIVYTEAVGNEIHLCVQDFGIGISRDKQDKVFEQFYRVSGDTEHTFPGLGLGLFISSEIVKRMGGKIWVNSVEGKGSLFCIAMPLLEAEVQ